MAKAIWLNTKDNVVICLEPVKKGDIVIYASNKKIVAKDDIDIGHKIAIKTIKKGNYIIKYGEKIGIARQDIEKGSHVHIHNVASIRLKERDL